MCCLWGRWPASAIDVCTLTLGPEFPAYTKQWSPITAKWILEEAPEKPYSVRGPGLPLGMRVGEEGIIGVTRCYNLNGDEFIPWAEARAHELPLITVPTHLVDGRKPKPPDPNSEPRIVEIEFPQGSNGQPFSRDDIEEALDEALTEADVGEVMGAGSGPGTGFDMAAEVDPRRLKTALRIIRQVLKRFGPPAGTRILEQHPEFTDPIEHPLEAPPKKDKTA